MEDFFVLIVNLLAGRENLVLNRACSRAGVTGLGKVQRISATGLW